MYVVEPTRVSIHRRVVEARQVHAGHHVLTNREAEGFQDGLLVRRQRRTSSRIAARCSSTLRIAPTLTAQDCAGCDSPGRSLLIQLNRSAHHDAGLERPVAVHHERRRLDE